MLEWLSLAFDIAIKNMIRSAVRIKFGFPSLIGASPLRSPEEARLSPYWL